MTVILSLNRQWLRIQNNLADDYGPVAATFERSNLGEQQISKNLLNRQYTPINTKFPRLGVEPCSQLPTPDTDVTQASGTISSLRHYVGPSRTLCPLPLGWERG